MKAAILTPITLLLAINMMMVLPVDVVSQIIIIPSQGQNGNQGSGGSMFPFFQSGNGQQGQQQGMQQPQQSMFSFQPSSGLASLFNPQTSPFHQQQPQQQQYQHQPMPANNLFRPNFGGGALPFSNQYQTPESPAVTQSSPGPLPSLEQTLAMLLRPLAGNAQVTQETVPSENSQQRRRRRQQYFY